MILQLLSSPQRHNEPQCTRGGGGGGTSALHQQCLYAAFALKIVFLLSERPVRYYLFHFPVNDLSCKPKSQLDTRQYIHTQCIHTLFNTGAQCKQEFEPVVWVQWRELKMVCVCVCVSQTDPPAPSPAVCPAQTVALCLVPWPDGVPADPWAQESA